MPSNTDVRVGAPDQKITGAIKRAPLGTAIPTLASIKKSGVTINSAFAGDEYVSEDGLTLSPNMSTADVKDWSGATVRKLLDSFDGQLSWTMISTNKNALGIAFGDANVTFVTASTDHGGQTMAALGAYLPEEQAWVFLMKDGDARVVIAVPDGQITNVGEVSFKSNEAIAWPVTLSCYPDSDGKSIYIMTDDGQVTSA